MRMYGELADWFHLLSPPQEYAEEAADYASFLADACPDAMTCSNWAAGGNTASYLKRRFACTLTDLSPEMLALSSGINPECENIHGHMRTMRLGRQFDAVFVHDAIVSMLTRADLWAAIETA